MKNKWGLTFNLHDLDIVHRLDDLLKETSKKTKRLLWNKARLTFLMKFEVYKRDSGKCQHCGEMGDTIDHIHPRRWGGKNELDNLQVLCKTCNTKKGENI